MLPQGSSFTTRPQLAGSFGMVASTHWLATASGMAVLEAGGTAFDAAVAAGLVLQVVEPHMNGLGGEAPIIGYDVGGGNGGTGVFVVDGQGPAPDAATLAVFGALDLDLIPGNGLLAACVPAAFGSWMLLLQQHGRMRLRDVMQYAIGYARDGYPMAAGVSAGIAAAEPIFREHGRSARARGPVRQSGPGRDLPAHPGRG
jgi:gamma-glutamyltranspeptidase/glutathione hydrolase